MYKTGAHSTKVEWLVARTPGACKRIWSSVPRLPERKFDGVVQVIEPNMTPSHTTPHPIQNQALISSEKPSMKLYVILISGGAGVYGRGHLEGQGT